MSNQFRGVSIFRRGSRFGDRSYHVFLVGGGKLGKLGKYPIKNPKQKPLSKTPRFPTPTLSNFCIYTIFISVDDTNDPRYAKTLSYYYKWWSKGKNGAIHCRNILAITLKCGDIILPLNIRIVSKQRRRNTDKSTCFRTMIEEVLDVFDAHGMDLRKYPIPFDSWYGSKDLIETLLGLGFTCVLVHGKSNYVMEINGQTAKLSAHKKTVKLHTNQWGCDKPMRRLPAKSPTFGELVLLFFSAHGKTQTMMVFGRPLRAAEILHIWSQHHGIEQFWRHLKTDLRLSAMSLHHRNGAYGALGIKILSYLMIQQVSCSTRNPLFIR